MELSLRRTGSMKASYKWFAATCLLLACAPCMANAPAPTEIERGFQSMYNLQFDQAHQDFSTWEQLHPADPLGRSPKLPDIFSASLPASASLRASSLPTTRHLNPVAG